MSVLQIVVGIVSILLSVAITFAVMGQQATRSGVAGAISGGGDTYLSKNRGRSVDAFLGRMTVILLIVFGVVMLAANAISILHK